MFLKFTANPWLIWFPFIFERKKLLEEKFSDEWNFLILHIFYRTIVLGSRKIFFKSNINPFLISSLQVSPCYRYSFNRSALNTRSAWLVHKRSENKTFGRHIQHKRFLQSWYFVAKYLSRISQHATRWMFSRWWIVLPGFVAATNIAHKSGV